MRVKLIGVPVAVVVAIGLVVLVTSARSGPSSAPLVAAPEDGAREAVVSVKGLVCSICARHLQSRLGKLMGVNDVRVDVDKQTAVLSLKSDADVTEDEIKDAVQDAGFTVTGVEWRDKPPVASAGGATAEFKIDGMHCSLCAANLARVLEEQPGVATARVDLDKKLAVVQYDATNTTTEQIKKTIEETGVFRAEPVSRPLPKDEK